MPLLRRAALLVVLAPACRAPAEAPLTTGAGRPAATDAGLGPVAKVERAATVHMPSHFAELLEVHSSLMRGAVPEARQAAAHIVEERPSVMLEAWAPYLLATHEAAKGVVAATDLATAARAAAELARTCGACHRAQAAGLTRTAGTAPVAEAGDDAALMRRHKWAVDRLWEALVLPSDAAWSEGVGAFVPLPSCDADLSGEQDREAIRRARETVQSLEKSARDAATLEARTEVYGALLPTCASCHNGQC